MRNNLEAEGLLCADPTGHENSVTSSSPVNFWFQKPPLPSATFIGIATQEARVGHAGFLTCPRVLWVAHQWAGHHWQSFVTCHHQKTWRVGEHIPETKEVQARCETPERKGARTESHRCQQIHPWVYSSFLHLGFSFPVWVPVFAVRWEGLLKDKFIQRLH